MNGTVIVTCDAVGQQEVRSAVELLDDAEDVVPAAGVQPGRVVAQLVQDLVHLEGRQDGLEQHRGLDRAARNAQRVLGELEDVVPQPRLAVAFQLGQVEVRAAAALEQPARVVEEVQAEVEERAEMGSPSTRTCFSGRCQPRGRTSSVAVCSLSR